MMFKLKKSVSMLLLVVLLFGTFTGVQGTETETDNAESVMLFEKIQEVVDYYRADKSDISSTQNNWWEIVALGTIGHDFTDNSLTYPALTSLQPYSKEMLSAYPMLSLLWADEILCMVSMGADPTEHYGRNYVEELIDVVSIEANMLKTGNIGELTENYYVYPNIFYALNAVNSIDCVEYFVPTLLALQNESGGFDAFGFGEDIDTTAMFIVALEPFRNSSEVGAEVTEALTKALQYLKGVQMADGGFCYSSTWDTKSNANSTAVAIMAIRAMGENPLDWTVGESVLKTPVHALLQYMMDNGSFAVEDWQSGEFVSDPMATQQSLLALCAIGVEGNIFTALRTPGAFRDAEIPLVEPEIPEETATPSPAATSGTDGGSGGGGGGSTTRYTRLIVVDHNENTLYNKKSYKIETGETAYTLLLKSGADVRTRTESDGIYVTAIDNLAEKTVSKTSGWKFGVQSEGASKWKVPGQGANSYKVQDGDYVCWYYALTPEDRPSDSLLQGSSGGSSRGGSSSKSSPSPSPSVSPSPAPTEEPSIAAFAEINQIKEKINGYKNTSSQAVNVLLNKGSHDWAAYAGSLAGVDLPSGYTDIIKELREQEDFYKVTDIERYILNYSALGLDPSELLELLYNHDEIDMQGLNGVAFALIAYDTSNAAPPTNAKNTRESLLNHLTNSQNQSGGFSLEPDLKPSVDITGMALTALAPYKDKADIKAAAAKAFEWLEGERLDNYGFLSVDEIENSESLAWVIIARAMFGLSCEEYLNELMNYQLSDGGFEHIKGEGFDVMATSQAALAIGTLISYLQNNLTEDTGFKDYADVSNWAADYMDKAVQLGIIVGADDNLLLPKSDVTRAQLVTILLRVIEDKGEAVSVGVIGNGFDDVKPEHWFYNSVTRAYAMEIIGGRYDNVFDPDAYVTRQETAAIVGKLLKLSGGSEAPQDIDNCADWAKDYVKGMFSEKLMTGDGTSFNPHGNLTREMMIKIIITAFCN